MLDWKVLQFAPCQSAVEPSFWERLAKHKINTAQLNEAPHGLTGFYVPANHSQFPSPFSLSADSFFEHDGGDGGGGAQSRGGRRFQIPGSLHNFNTVEKFKDIDKAGLLTTAAQQIWEDIKSGRAEADPRLLSRFLLISFADLKKWSFLYRLAFPGLVLPEPAKSAPPRNAKEVFTGNEAAAVLEACETWRQPIIQDTVDTTSSPASFTSGQGGPAFLLHVRPGGSVEAHALGAWTNLNEQAGQVFLAFFDPCHLLSNPGWPLRNLLALAVARWSATSLQVLCVRERRGKPDLEHSIVLDVSLPPLPEWQNKQECPDAVGWELNAKGKGGPRFVDLAPSMDPTRLAMEAADLNLKLMRWRMLPSLDLARLADCRCLILGAGTLGCQVARGLMAWGIRRITFVDYGRVAMSNPLRQSLYVLEDCQNGGQPKAQAAADSLRRIHPGVDAKGLQMAIPMPGHAVGKDEEEEVRSICKQLEGLVEEHDCVFLGTDTRESRWLPTLLCALHRKIAINAALGFDTFLVMRHGISAGIESHAGGTSGSGAPHEQPTGAEIGASWEGAKGATSDESAVRGDASAMPALRGPQLGCYFCNDVVAPLDSTANRPLDQQCTVTRPGLAPMAAALAVELAVSLLHHPMGAAAPADPAAEITASTEMPLGIIPHQVRGFLAHFAQLVVTGQPFDKCTACSTKVIAEYQKRGPDFLLQVFNEPSYLEDLTGLTEMLRSTPMSTDWEEEDDVGDEDDFVELK